MKRILLLFALCAFVALPVLSAHAFIIGDSNFGVFGYPDHDCRKPYIPFELDEYSSMTLANELESYKMCIEKYSNAAVLDAKRALEKSDEAIEEYNSFIRQLNSRY